MKIKLSTEAKNDFFKKIFKVMINFVFENIMENVRKHRDIKIVTTNKRSNQLVCEPNYHTNKWFPEGLLETEIKKVKVKMNKPVNLVLSILEISKTLMCKSWWDYINIQIVYRYYNIVLSLTLKMIMFMTILLMMLKKDLIHQIMKLIDHCLQEKAKKLLLW